MGDISTVAEFRKNFLAVLLGCAIVVVAALVMARTLDYVITSPQDRAFRSTFANVKLGMTEAQVIAFLGKPDSQGREFHLGQRDGFEDAYSRAERSDANKFLFWNREVGLVYAVGVDGTGRVVLLEKGGT